MFTNVSKTLMLLSFIALAPVAFAKSNLTVIRGQVLLNGKLKKVEVAYLPNGSSSSEYIKLGDQRFDMIDRSRDEFSGRQIVTSNGKIILNHSVSVLRGDMMQTALNYASQLDNAKELNCTDESSYLLILTDEFNAPYPAMGNCLELK